MAKWNAESVFDTADLIGPVAFLAAAGVLLGLLGALRWSPAGPLVAGLLLVVPTVFMFINPFETLDAFSVDQPRRLLNQDLQPWLPVENGTLLVLGALLLMAVFSAQRWRRWPAAAALAPAALTEQRQPQPMSDEEILAAAAAMEQEEQATAEEQTDAEESEETEPAREPEPASASDSTPESPPEPESEPSPEAEPPEERRGTESGTRSGASGTA